MYMTSEEDLRAALVTAYKHCGPGGVVVIAPDWVAETFQPRTTHEGRDDGGRGVRYLEWVLDADPNDSKVNYEFILALKENDEIRTVVDRRSLASSRAQPGYGCWKTSASRPRSSKTPQPRANAAKSF
jgi:hypothetical protein